MLASGLVELWSVQLAKHGRGGVIKDNSLRELSKKSTKLETASEQGGGGFGPSLNPYSEILKKLGEKIEI